MKRMLCKAIPTAIALAALIVGTTFAASTNTVTLGAKSGQELFTNYTPGATSAYGRGTCYGEGSSMNLRLWRTDMEPERYIYSITVSSGSTNVETPSDRAPSEKPNYRVSIRANAPSTFAGGHGYCNYTTY